MQSNAADNVSAPPDAVTGQLARMLGHRSFALAGSQRRFLQFVVEETLAGRGSQLKEQVVGVEVFGRGESFDPRLDTIVRVEARRLRAKLDQYYRTDGASDPVIITLPKGGYLPLFQERRAPANGESARPRASGEWRYPAIAAGAVVLLAATALLWRLPGRPHASPAPENSVAVLPFANVGSDPDTEYFADGLTAELISSLAAVDGLRVIASSSVFGYKKQPRDVRKIGGELSVRSVVEGSVRRSGSRVRVTASLVDASTGYEMLSRTYDRELKDTFAIQRDIAASITDALKPHAGRPRSDSACGGNQESYDLYLRALYAESRRDTADLTRSLELLERAAALSPRCPMILERLAESYILHGFYGLRRPAEVMPKAKAAALRALELDPLSSQAHAALGAELSLYEWDWKRAEDEFRAALRAGPGSPESHQWYAAFVLTPEGRGTEAVAQAREAQRLSPLSLPARSVEGYSLFFADRWDEAIRHARELIELDPGYYHPYLYLGWSLAQKGQLAEAFQAIEKADRLSGSNTITRYELAVAYAKLNRRAEALKIARDLERAGAAGADTSVALAHIYAVLGQPDAALRRLAKAREERSPMLIYIRIAHDYDSLRSESRFVTVSRDVGLAN